MSETITDYEIYNSRMKRSIGDKLFWRGILGDDIEEVVDYGCADGFLLKELKTLDPSLICVGYDTNPEMVDLCTENGVMATDFFEGIHVVKNSLLNLSSIIHEVYSYSPGDGAKEFWKRVFNSNFKYIAIRDMCVEKGPLHPSKASDSDVHKLLAYLNKQGKLTMVDDFQKIWGDITDRHNFVHFLMKYTYEENWEREVVENYFPIHLPMLLYIIGEHGRNYEIIYKDHNVLPFKVAEIKEHTGIDLKTKTHLKLLLRRKR